MSLIGKRIEYKYNLHPKTTEAIVLDKVNVHDKGTLNDFKLEWEGSGMITKYLVQIIDADSIIRNGTTILITPDMIKRVLE